MEQWTEDLDKKNSIDVRERPFNLKEGGGYGFFLKKIF
jgi:hypothetical protein